MKRRAGFFLYLLLSFVLPVLRAILTFHRMLGPSPKSVMDR